tara:strand:- start:671 stop:871 length:201 start_codon:yes stop_codon:yes gene_type:complete
MSEQERSLFELSAKDLGEFIFKTMSFCVGFYFFLDYVYRCKVKTKHGLISLVIGLIIASILIGMTR